jgi:hypothetical protein
MDLDEHSRPDLAWRFLNRYLEETGDYAGMRLLRYYRVYGAMVWAKVARIRAAQGHIGEEERQTALHGYAAYLGHAQRMTQPAVPALILMHGLSSSGKTYASQGRLEGLGALRLHESERLRAEGLYGEAATRATYERLASLAGISLGAGYTTIVDAAFLQRWQRDRFRGIATARGVPLPDRSLPCRGAGNGVPPRRAGEAGCLGGDGGRHAVAAPFRGAARRRRDR